MKQKKGNNCSIDENILNLIYQSVLCYVYYPCPSELDGDRLCNFNQITCIWHKNATYIQFCLI